MGLSPKANVIHMWNRTESSRDASPASAIARALSAAAIMGVGLMLASSLGQLAGASAGAEQPLGERVLVAAPVALVVTAAIALLWEAIPEEISIRSYALTALRAAFGRILAAVLTIVTFMLVPLIAMGTEALLDLLTRTGEVQLWLSPPGGDPPLVYYSMLAVFGLLLIYARDATATVWTCIGAHLAWLTVNRIVLGQTEGAQVDLGEGGMFIFLGAYTTLAIVGFSMLAQRARPSNRTDMT